MTATRTLTVTRIIAPWVKFDHVPEARLAMAAERGTLIHSACSSIAEGVGWFPLDDSGRGVIGYVDSFRKWFDAIVEKVLFTERELKDPRFGFVGHPDLLVLSKNKKILLVDLKSPVTKSKSWRIQLAAYCHLCQQAGYSPDKIGSLRLHPEGKTPIMDWYEGSTAQDFTIFLSCLNAYRFFNS